MKGGQEYYRGHDLLSMHLWIRDDVLERMLFSVLGELDWERKPQNRGHGYTQSWLLLSGSNWRFNGVSVRPSDRWKKNPKTIWVFEEKKKRKRWEDVNVKYEWVGSGDFGLRMGWWERETYAVRPKIGFVPPASRPVKNRCMRTFPFKLFPDHSTSLCVWYFSSSISGSVAKGGSVCNNDIRGCENRDSTSTELRIGCGFVWLLDSRKWRVEEIRTNPDWLV